MKRKDYEKPTTIVVQLRQRTHLLQASGQAGVQSYKWNYEDEE